jgi:hypothetical protein
MKHHSILSENSEHHWPVLNTENKILLDLGCGRHCTDDLYQSSPVYLGEKGALKVIALDANITEIDYFNSCGLDESKYTFIHRYINSSNDIKDLIREYQPSAIKCDIEGHEINFYELSKSDMSGVLEFALEYHSSEIREKMIEKINDWGFDIHTEAKFAFVDAMHMGVLFGSK